MNAALIVIGALIFYLLAFRFYGRFLAHKVFHINKSTQCPSHALEDGQDYVPTRPSVLFGHHFTSIAGTGPIVGPAIALVWGWVPALVWVLFGAVLLGAVHDFGSMVVSLRHEGRSIGDIAGRLVSKRVRILFMSIIFLELWIVIAIFGLVIAIVFEMFPQAVIPVWAQIPIALVFGHLVSKKGFSAFRAGLVGVCAMYLCVIAGSFFPIKMPEIFGMAPAGVWTIIMLVYCYFASVLPVQTLLQPRDYLNGFQLLIAMGLLFAGVMISRPEMVAPGLNMHPGGAPSFFPMLFVVVACGAISGFHSLVSSGTSAKQCDHEPDAVPISFGGMLLEGMLAVLVIAACGAGLGLGLETQDGTVLSGIAAFKHQYMGWNAGLGPNIRAFVTGTANMLKPLGLPTEVSASIMGVFVVSFAATTLDTATRLQRYVISEELASLKMPYLAGKHQATLIAVISAAVLAFYNGSGKGALILWPLFGAVNQLLAGLALLVITVYLARRHISFVYTLAPMIFMAVVTMWAMIININSYYEKQNWLLLVIGTIVFGLEVLMLAEGIIVLRNIGRKGRVRAAKHIPDDFPHTI